MFITGYSDAKVAKDAVNKAGIHNYIEKPWDNEAVRLTVYEALKRKTERESEKLVNVDNVKEALAMLRKHQESISHTTKKENAPPPTIIFEFSSSAEFNTFSFEIQKFDDVNVVDVHMFENRYIITVSVSPYFYRGWKRLDFGVGKKNTV